MLSVVDKFPGQVEAGIRDLNNDNLSQPLLNRNGENDKGSTEGLETSTIFLGVYELSQQRTCATAAAVNYGG